MFIIKKFFKDDFFFVYRGEFILVDEGYRREEFYYVDLGSFFFFLKMVLSFFGKLVSCIFKLVFFGYYVINVIIN